MLNFAKKLWMDENGVIISAELVLVLTIPVLGCLVGLREVSIGVIHELADISNAWGALDQSYQYVGFESIDGTKVKSKVSGGIWTDEVDSCDSCSGTANLLACDVPALTEGKGATP